MSFSVHDIQVTLGLGANGIMPQAFIGGATGYCPSTAQATVVTVTTTGVLANSAFEVLFN